MKRKGFTLMEIMVVVGILLIILSIAVPSLLKIVRTTEESKIQAELKSLYNAIIMFYTYENRFPKNLSELKEYITVSDIEDKYVLNPDLP